MAFHKIEDFFVSEINAVVEIAAPKHIIVRKNVSSLSHKKKKKMMIRPTARKVGEGRKINSLYR